MDMQHMLVEKETCGRRPRTARAFGRASIPKDIVSAIMTTVKLVMNSDSSSEEMFTHSRLPGWLLVLPFDSLASFTCEPTYHHAIVLYLT